MSYSLLLLRYLSIYIYIMYIYSICSRLLHWKLFQVGSRVHYYVIFWRTLSQRNVLGSSTTFSALVQESAISRSLVHLVMPHIKTTKDHQRAKESV